MKNENLFVILAISLFANFVFVMKEVANYINNQTEHKPEPVIEYVEVFVPDTLSEWDIFTLALMKVESGYDSTAVSPGGATGYFQITPIYVKEVNRQHNTDYQFKDVTNFKTAYEIFDLMQQAHNPEYNLDRALELHNGNHDWYHNKVYKEMRSIQKYEEVRHKIKNKDDTYRRTD